MADEDGSVANQKEMLIALQGRILSLERITTALLTDMLYGHRQDSFENAAKKIRHAILGYVQQQDYHSTAYTDAVWEEAGRATRMQLDDLVMRAAALDGSASGDDF